MSFTHVMIFIFLRKKIKPLITIIIRIFDFLMRSQNIFSSFDLFEPSIKLIISYEFNQN